MTGLSYRPELDGVRAIAVYLVLLFHAGMATFGGGFIGVDLFFVLSGFLVTAVILDEIDRRGSFSIGSFYARRVRRLLPAAVVVIVVIAGIQVLVTSPPARLELIDDARAALLYFANWHFILESRDYFASGDEGSPYLHFWSLAIEEQFYIVFPLVVLATLRFSSRPLRTLSLSLVAVTIASVLLQLWRGGSDPTYAYYATETRIYQLAVGALLILGFRELNRRRRTALLQRWGTGVAAIGLLLLIGAASRWVDASASHRGLLATVASVLLIGGVWWAGHGWLGRLLARGVPRYLGKVSYGTYLWHWPVLLVLMEVFEARPLVIAVLGGAISTGLSAISFTLLEHPLRTAGALRQLRWPVVGVGLAVSLVAAFAITPRILQADTRPALAVASGSEASSQTAHLDRPLPPDLDLVAASEDVGPSTPPCTLDDPDACTVTDGSGAHLLLIGDSQARAFIPALTELAEEHDLSFSVNVLAGCPWQAGQVNLRATDEQVQTCTTARDKFFEDVLPAMEVDTTLAIGLSRSDAYWEERLSGGDPGEDLAALQLRTTTESADVITSTGSDLVIAHSMLGTEGFGIEGWDPLECLARAITLADCGVAAPVDRPTVDSAYVTLAVTDERVHTVDFNPMICPDHPVCAPVIDGTVVWRDPNHLTTTFLLDHKADLWRELKATGSVR